MLRKKITGAKYFSDSTKQMTNLNIATPIDKKDTNFSSSDILLAKDVVKLANSTNSEDVDKLKTSIESINKKIIDNQKNIAKISDDVSKLNSKSTDLFEVVMDLPTENISTSKIYCIPPFQGNNDFFYRTDKNTYELYCYVKDLNGNYTWERVKDPQLNNFARLDKDNEYLNINNTFLQGAQVFDCAATITTANITDAFIENIYPAYDDEKYLKVGGLPDQSPTKVFATNGDLTEIGTEEDLIFTLEDGSTVTKKIRVLSTTATPAT